MSANISRDSLELEKLCQEIETELSRKYNWAKQGEFWQRQQFSMERQERYWRWQQWILLGTFIIGVLAWCCVYGHERPASPP